ncbi:unnamed protein product [Bursaphelenchus okinawaensis]|uniref:Uncharacterized protein n=1 Tax=Bursaphelenchus okinawaensis TaxID=465554 RepID=A0A811LFG7_9BILA|nr:unnamed protein product [Bursaphelenchus okinawaensis]CAG9122000.1 unnamed protein product [Bursaphelenchus okinawaensis]
MEEVCTDNANVFLGIFVGCAIASIVLLTVCSGTALIYRPYIRYVYRKMTRTDVDKKKMKENAKIRKGKK